MGKKKTRATIGIATLGTVMALGYAYMKHNEINNGGVLQGRRLDPVSFLMAGLAQRYAQLGDESRLAAMVEFPSFQRLQGEGINQLLDRYSIVLTQSGN